jgi:hypothetical protein
VAGFDAGRVQTCGTCGFQGWIDLVSLGAEIVRDRHQGSSRRSIIHSRRHAQAATRLPTQVRASRHCRRAPESNLTPEPPRGSGGSSENLGRGGAPLVGGNPYSVGVPKPADKTTRLCAVADGRRLPHLGWRTRAHASCSRTRWVARSCWIKMFWVQTFLVQTRIDLVGFAAEILGHHHQGRDHVLIVHRRRYAKAERRLATQIRTTHHDWNSPVYSDQLTSLRAVPVSVQNDWAERELFRAGEPVDFLLRPSLGIMKYDPGGVALPGTDPAHAVAHVDPIGAA